MKTKILPIPLSVVILLSFLVYATGANPPNSIYSIDSIRTEVNTEIQIEINISAEYPIYAWSLGITIDNASIEYIDVVYGPLLSSENGILNYTQETGTGITLMQTKTGVVQGTSGNGTLATIYLKPIKIGNYYVNLSNPQAVGQEGGELYPIDIIVATPLIEIISVENRADVNSDGRVDIFDLAKVGLCYGLPVKGNCKIADVTGDKLINIFDLAYVALNYGWSA